MNAKLYAQNQSRNEENYKDKCRKLSFHALSRHQFITELQSQWIVFIDSWLDALKIQ